MTNAHAFTLRPYVAEDAPHLARLYFESARTLGARRYTPEQVEAWAPEPADPAVVHRRASDGRLTLVACTADGRVLAYGDLEPDGHIAHLYAHPRASGSGVAGAVLRGLIDAAAQRGYADLHVEASELARGLFERTGFRLVRRRDFEIRGIAIHNYAMALRL
jgi:putative acetyltransferase